MDPNVAAMVEQTMPSPANTCSFGTEQVTVANVPTTTSYRCSMCPRGYERLDHLRRHELSHQNPRNHACTQCGMRFNRKRVNEKTRDLLARHLSTHEGSDECRSRHSKRAQQACSNCISSKAKCSNQRPCERCQSKGILCLEGTSRRRGRGKRASTPGYDDGFRPEQDAHIQPAHFRAQGNKMANSEPEEQSYECVGDPSTLMGIFSGQLPSSDKNDLPRSNTPVRFPQDGVASLETIEPIPSMNSTGQQDDFINLPIPFDLFSVLQDSDFYVDDIFESLQSEAPVASVSDDASQIQATNELSDPAQGQPPSTQRRSDVLKARSLGYEAFKRSPWLWTPANQDNAYAEGKQLAVDETQMMNPSNPACSRQSSFQSPSITGTAARDEMLSMVLKFSKSNFKIRSFPSLSLLNSLMQAFFVRQNDSCDSWIHVGTFEPETCKTERLAAVVATGSSLFAVSNVWKMGLALQEIVRLSICDSVDGDNRLIRDLESNQTFLLWIELGLWSGFRRKMEIGEGFAHTLPTMLRRAGAFRQTFYSPSIIPIMEDDATILRVKWMKWVHQESNKRLALRLLINEMRSSMAFVRSPVFSGQELTFCLPAARDLWDAKNPEEWRARFLKKTRTSVSLTVLEALHDISRLKNEMDAIDMPLSALAIVYALWGRVWSYLDSKMLTLQSNSSATAGNVGGFWVEAQRQELIKHIQTTIFKLKWLKALSPECRLVSDFLLMSLYSPTDEIQRFAGRYGDGEAAQALPRLRQWIASEDRNLALWHAGQIIKAARAFPPTHLGGFHAISVYFACLSLWVFTILNGDASASSDGDASGQQQENSQRSQVSKGQEMNGYQLPTPRLTEAASGESRVSQPNSDCTPRVFIDGENGEDVELFLRTGFGQPFMHIDGREEQLNQPLLIPSLMMKVFRENFPSQSHPLPPLLELLSGLVKDLGNLTFM